MIYAARSPQLPGTEVADDGGPQIVTSSVFTLKFEDPAVTAKEQKEHAEKLRERLTEMLKIQRGLLEQTVAAKADDHSAFLAVATGQSDLRTLMKTTADTFHFEPDELLDAKGIAQDVIRGGEGRH